MPGFLPRKAARGGSLLHFFTIRVPRNNMAADRQLTQLLNEWRTADDAALLEKIVPAVYDELHRLARAYMRGQPAEHTLQATALINEAFLRLRDVKTELKDRGHFIGIVANVMRHVLVDHARAKQAHKRGGGAPRAGNARWDRTHVCGSRSSLAESAGPAG